MKLSEVSQHICAPLELATGKPVVVAGGAVRDHLLGRKPRDYDIFILGGKLGPPMYNKLLKDARAHMALNFTDSTFPATKKYEGHPAFTPITECTFRGHKVQVMASEAPSVDALLQSFDWNICGFAYANGLHQQLSKLTLGIMQLHGTLKLTSDNLPAPLVTLRRGYLFAERYGMRFPEETQRRLCKMAVDATVNVTSDNSKFEVELAKFDIGSTGKTLTAEHIKAAWKSLKSPKTLIAHGIGYTSSTVVDDTGAAVEMAGKLMSYNKINAPEQLT